MRPCWHDRHEIVPRLLLLLKTKTNNAVLIKTCASVTHLRQLFPQSPSCTLWLRRCRRNESQSSAVCVRSQSLHVPARSPAELFLLALYPEHIRILSLPYAVTTNFFTSTFNYCFAQTLMQKWPISWGQDWQRTRNNKIVLRPSHHNNPDEPAPEPSAVLGFHVANRSYCSPSHHVLILSSSPLAAAEFITGTTCWVTEGDLINSDPRDFILDTLSVAAISINPDLRSAPKCTGYITHRLDIE